MLRQKRRQKKKLKNYKIAQIKCNYIQNRIQLSIVIVCKIKLMNYQ
jgi:hypothetical protein